MKQTWLNLQMKKLQQTDKIVCEAQSVLIATTWSISVVPLNRFRFSLSLSWNLTLNLRAICPSQVRLMFAFGLLRIANSE